MLSIKLNADRAIAGLTDLQQRQIPFAMANAINRTAEEVQQAERDHISKAFTIRRPFVLSNVRIARSDFATKTRMQATIAIPDDSVLTKFEGGGIKSPRAGGRAIAVPIDVKRNKSDIITNANRPRAFAFVRARSSIKTRNAVYMGKGRTFMIQLADGSGWILKRTGRGKKGALFEGTSVLYVLRPQVRIPNLLDYYTIGETVAVRRFPLNMQGMLDYALRTAK